MPAEEASGDGLDRGAGTAVAAATLPKKIGLGGQYGGVAVLGREDRPSQGRRSGDRRGTTGSGISTVAVIPCYQ